MSTQWDNLTLDERIIAVKLYCLRHSDFVQLATSTQVGKTVLK
ncbi:hypothetical protein FERRO_07540 [Ferrovum sp. JA12]|jgi:hypothetical protein|nr:hypothetical protein [Ferrovum sp. JA12]KRH79682.1 hypothetical protein FERRO_07540 [Ferrovum sp. JA12]HQT80593.1 hypothetical protein [Ferrovaceae bacterium]HQU06698.1 hypothetical protein [Ferrovaceae bacterium]